MTTSPGLVHMMVCMRIACIDPDPSGLGWMQADCAERRAAHEQQQLDRQKQGQKDGKSVPEAGSSQ